MKEARTMVLSAVLVALAGCAHSTGTETKTEKETAGATGGNAEAQQAVAPRSDQQLAIDEAEKAVQAANDELARSGNSAQTQHLSSIAMKKVEQATVSASAPACQQRA